MKMKRELLVRILTVVAPLVMLCALSIAWFVNSVTPQVTQMSFASTDAGPGAAMHKAKTITRSSDYPEVISDVEWGPEVSNNKAQNSDDDSSITIENMVPNQCEYYLLLSNHEFSVNLSKIKLWTPQADGTLAEAPDPYPAQPSSVPLTDCLAFYLFPLEAGANIQPVSPSKLTDMTKVLFTPEAHDQATRLSAALLAKLPGDTLSENAALPIPIVGAPAGTYYDAYVLAIYYDPVYSQAVEGAAKNTATIPGKVSFALSFPSQTQEAANG